MEINLKKFVLKRKGSILLPFLLLSTCLSFGQTNISGKPGLIYIPTAVKTEDGSFKIGYAYNPIKYGLRKRGKNPERIIFANLNILPRLEVNINFLQMISTDSSKVREALGDRQLDLRYLLFKETKYRPSVAIVMSSPFTIDAALLTHVVVATKNLKINELFTAQVNFGLGSPYYVYRKEGNLSNNDTFGKFTWQKKSENRYKNHYLEGPFGGINLKYKDLAGIMIEYDSQHINIGAYANLFKHWTIQAGVLNADQITVGTSYAFNLLKKPKRLEK